MCILPILAIAIAKNSVLKNLNCNELTQIFGQKCSVFDILVLTEIRCRVWRPWTMENLTVIQLHSTFRFPSNVSVTTRDGPTKLREKLYQSVRSIVIDFSRG